jgi:nucleoside-diphosphate-sugar epimerase
MAYARRCGMTVRIARFQNCYGPEGTWTGGREKAPAAICRKVIEAKAAGRDTIEIWGDGTQARSFMYIDDCVEGIDRIVHCDRLAATPVNLGSTEQVTVNGLVDLVEAIAGVRLRRRYDRSAPRGVGGRNSDNTFLRRTLGWEPRTPLRDGLARTYAWIEEQVRARRAGRRVVV